MSEEYESSPSQGSESDMMYGRGYGSGYGGGYSGMMGGGGWFVGFLMLVFGLLVITLVVLLVVWAVRASSGHGHAVAHHPPAGAPMAPGAAGHDEAVAIAKKRLASGEIKPDEYAEIMKHLGG
jgi:uncharacterized membrane protein